MSQRTPKSCPGALRDPVQVVVSEEALRQYREGYAPDSFIRHDGEKSVFDPAIEHRIRGLMDEQRSAQFAQDGDCLGGALVRVGGDAHVERLPGSDCRMKSSEGFLKGCLGIKVV